MFDTPTKGKAMNQTKRLQAEAEELKTRREHDQEVIDDLVRYLTSPKFFEDTTVQTKDVLNRLER